MSKFPLLISVKYIVAIRTLYEPKSLNTSMSPNIHIISTIQHTWHGRDIVVLGVG